MTRHGLHWRVLSGTCVYVVVVAAVVGGAYSASIALTAESASGVAPQASVEKIGPGYARLPPVDFGKPAKVVDSTPRGSQMTKPAVARPKQ